MPLVLDESQFTLAEVARRYRAGTLSPVDVIEECLRRIDRYEPQVRAWVSVDADAARAQARRAAEEFAAGREPGKLAGIPIGIKDLIDVAGWPTLAGSITRAGHVAEEDAPLVAHLRQAGAILLGKTVTTEFACFDPPMTRNPWNLAHTPGGSSSGSCAAVALGMCLGAIGTQTGGSINRPASFCGVAGFKPAYGAVSMQGVVPLSRSLDHAGPIARKVEDLAMLFGAMEPKLSDSPWRDPIEQLASPPRLWINEEFISQADEAMRAAFGAACEKLIAAGAIIEPRELPSGFDRVHEMHLRIFRAEAAQEHRKVFADRPGDFGPAIRGFIEAGLAMAATDLVEAQCHQLDFKHDLMAQSLEPLGGYWFLPAAVGPAPGPQTTGDPRFNSPWSYAGCPALNLPCGLSRDGLPLGVQVVDGLPWDENGLTATALWCEEVLGFERHAALLHKDG